MAEFGLPRDDEPFDFRRQAATYGRFRRDYSAGLYDAIAARTGPAAGRRAIDLGCGPGFVTDSLAKRGWRAIGLDLSAPMLAAARGALPDATLVRARAEAMPLRAGSADLVTAGTAFHWMPPAATIAEVSRVLRPGGRMAIFWRFAKRDTDGPRVIRDALARVGVVAPDGFEALASPAVFEGSALVLDDDLRLDTTLEFTADEFHGCTATIEWLRRLTGPAHDRFLDALATELARRHPRGIREPSEESLLIARRA